MGIKKQKKNAIKKELNSQKGNNGVIYENGNGSNGHSSQIYQEPMFSKEALRCSEISQDQCKELREMKYSNDPDDLFLEIRSLEERFKYKLEQKQVEIDEQVKMAQIKNSDKYRKILEDRKKKIEFDLKQKRIEADKKIEKLETKEHMYLSKFELAYNLKKQELIESVLKILEFDF